jgi:hypothetical protein
MKTYLKLTERIKNKISVVNFIQQPLPEGSRTGAGDQPGALNMGQRASTGLTTCKLCRCFCVLYVPENGE